MFLTLHDSFQKNLALTHPYLYDHIQTDYYVITLLCLKFPDWYRPNSVTFALSLVPQQPVPYKQLTVNLSNLTSKVPSCWENFCPPFCPTELLWNFHQDFPTFALSLADLERNPCVVTVQWQLAHQFVAHTALQWFCNITG